MRSMGRSMIAGAALVLVPLAAANATDLSNQGYKRVIDNTDGGYIPVPAPVPIPDTHSMYVRGDIGLASHDVPDIDIGGVDFAQEDMDDIFTAGVGVGVYFRESIRGDITVDYRWEADVSAVNPTTGNKHDTEIDSILALGNIYYDFMDRDRFTPYVGLGVGYVKHDTRRRTIAVNGGPTFTSNGADSSDLAVAAMAGFSYAVHKGFLIDAGYRYLHLGDTKTNPTANGQFGALEIQDIEAHEIRFGLRYEIY